MPTTAEAMETDLRAADERLRTEAVDALATAGSMRMIMGMSTVRCEGCRANATALEAWGLALMHLISKRPDLTGHKHKHGDGDDG